jgi:hypothetical protein
MHAITRRWRTLSVVALVPCLLVLAGCTRFGATLDRSGDPVVFDGASVPKLLGVSVPSVVGFAWDGRAWHQIPVQVDERDFVNPGKILHRPAANWAKKANGADYTFLAYTTPTAASPGYTSWATFTGVDRNPLFDANDQVSFLSDDSGRQAPAGTVAPPGTAAASRAQLKATDPLESSAVGYVYLFRSTNPSLTGGSAGTTGVAYTFSLDSGNYTTTYNMGAGALAPNNVAGFNPEHSTITTSAYTVKYGDRWLNNGAIIAGGSPAGTSMLERGRYQFAPGVCGRSEDTFDGGATNPYEGAFIANISGPVRAIRSYIGANSGQYTANTDIFYPQREDTVTDLRVHAIPSIMGFDDFTTGLTGMKYSDDQNSNVPIDGTPDSIVATHAAPWQMVSGGAGSIVTAHNIVTDISGLALSTYYLDQNPASPLPCTGDNAAWGQNGTRVDGPGGTIPCTDPTRADCPAGVVKSFVSSRYRYYQAPNLSTAAAAGLSNRALAPIQVTVTG